MSPGIRDMIEDHGLDVEGSIFLTRCGQNSRGS